MTPPCHGAIDRRRLPSFTRAAGPSTCLPRAQSPSGPTPSSCSTLTGCPYREAPVLTNSCPQSRPAASGGGPPSQFLVGQSSAGPLRTCPASRSPLLMRRAAVPLRCVTTERRAARSTGSRWARSITARRATSMRPSRPRRRVAGGTGPTATRASRTSLRGQRPSRRNIRRAPHPNLALTLALALALAQAPASALT